MAPTYARVAQHLLACCSEYREGDGGLEALKSAVWNAAGEVRLPEERSLRDFLQRAEGQLDMIQFTVGADDVRAAVLEVVMALEARLRSYLARGGA